MTAEADTSSVRPAPPDSAADSARVRNLLLGSGAAYAVATLLTEPVFVADTPDMAWSSVAHVLGQDCSYLEPGHLLWRPTGFAMLQLFGSAREGTAVAAAMRASQIQLGWLAWTAGLVAVLCGAMWLHRRVGSVPAAAFGLAVIVVSKAFLNYSQVGVSYLPALACLMAAVMLLGRTRTTLLGDAFAGVLLGISVLMWGTFALAIPVALAQPMIFGSYPRRDLRRVLAAMAGGAACAVTAGLWVWTTLGFTSTSELTAWAATADHGLSTSGLPRAVLGFARSYLETGDYGKMVKRFMLGDPTDPVSTRELIGLPFFGILAFYLGLLVAVIAAWKHVDGKRVLVFFALNAIPVAFFAIAWQGGDLERYLPLVPGIALLAAAGFAAARPWQRGVLGAWLVIMIVTNAFALGAPLVDARRDSMRMALDGVAGEGRPLLVFSHWQDERVQFDRNYPPQADPLPFQFYHLFTSNSASVEDWKPRAASRILAAFDTGTAVYVSERLLASSAKREWQWVEGDDPRVRWADLQAFFAPLAYADSGDGGSGGSGSSDGFRRLLPTDANRARLAEYADDPVNESENCPLPPLITRAGNRR